MKKDMRRTVARWRRGEGKEHEESLQLSPERTHRNRDTHGLMGWGLEGGGGEGEREEERDEARGRERRKVSSKSVSSVLYSPLLSSPLLSPHPTHRHDRELY